MVGAVAADEDIDEDIDDEDMEEYDDIDIDDESEDLEDEEDDFDEIAYYTNNYISFYDSKFNDTPENVSYSVKYDTVYQFLNNTSSEYENKFTDYEYFKIITKFYLKTYKNFTDEELNASEDFYKDLYGEFLDFLFSDLTSIGFTPKIKSIQLPDDYKRYYNENNLIFNTFNQTLNDNSSNIQLTDYSQGNFTILVILLILILFVVILERII